MSMKNIVKGIRQRAAHVSAGLKIAMAYKFEFILGTFTTPISLFIYYFLWKAIYAYSGTELIRGYTFDALINYFVLSMLVGYFAWSQVDGWMEFAIIHGEMVTELIRPISFITQEFFFEVGVKTLALFVQAIPLVIGAQLLIGLTFVSWQFTLLALVSLAMALTIFFLISYSIGLCAFWLNRISGIRRVKRGLILFLSGGMIPITFFPLWFINVSHYLPFEYIRFVPINVFLGQYGFTGEGFNNVFIVLGMQAAWVVALFVASVLIWKAAFKRFAGAGL